MAYHIVPLTEPGEDKSYVVGTYDPNGAWCPIKTFKSLNAAVWFVHYLHGGSAPFDLCDAGLATRMRPVGRK